MFDKSKAKTVETPKPAKAAKAVVEIKGLEEYGMIAALAKALEGVAVQARAAVIEAGMERFMSDVSEGRRPESFRGCEGIAEASIEFRRKGANIALNDAQVKLCREAGYEPSEAVSVQELWAINPIYAADQALLERVQGALAGVVPEDFIMLQPKVSKFTVSEDMLVKACSGKAPREVIEALTVVAIKPKLTMTNMQRVFDYVQALLTGAPKVESAANEAKAA
jgi:hypothetical protein